MWNAPHLLPGARRGVRYGDGVFVDTPDRDTLVRGFESIPMGAATKRYQARLGITREEQDAFAAESHARAAEAIKSGRLAEEIVPAPSTRRKSAVTVENDEGVQPGTTAGRLAALPPAFSKDGTITAGSASPLSDSACAVIVMDKTQAERAGLSWLAEIGNYGTVAVSDPSLLTQPARAIRDALRGDATTGMMDSLEEEVPS
jgi:acetyl-CoA C-acetyltransferase